MKNQKNRKNKPADLDFGRRVIKVYRDVDFSIIDGYEIDDNTDQIKMQTIEQHGTVIYVAGIVEGDDDALICMGAPSGSTEFRPVLYADFLEFEKGWLRLIGRDKEADKIEKMCRDMKKP